MATLNPLALISRFAEEIERGNLKGLLAQFDTGDFPVTRSGVAATGTAQLREVLAAFVTLQPSLIPHNRVVVDEGDVGMYCLSSADILRRQAYDNWLLADDNPCGTGVLV